jgi:hypothetical protein
MKRKIIVLLPLIFTLLLSSCGNKETSATIGPEIFTSVAQTLTAQYTPQEATETPTPTVEVPTEIVVPTIAVSPTVAYYPTSGTLCDNAAYVSDVTYPDGTNVAPDTDFTKTWKIQNTGTCTWTETYRIKFVSGSQMGGATTEIGQEVKPGETVKVSVDLTSPTTAGTYTGYWQMANDSGTLFGGYVSVSIYVTASTITVTPTKTGTPTQTPVYIVVTATPLPTETATATQEPTQ